MRLNLHHIENLSISEEKHDTSLHHVLEDKVFVIVANFVDVAHDKIIQSCLPSSSEFICLLVVVDLLLSYFSVEYLLVHAGSETRWYTSLRILDEEGLIVLVEQPFTDQYSLVDEVFLIIHANLSHLHIKLNKAASDTFQSHSFELHFDCAPV